MEILKIREENGNRWEPRCGAAMSCPIDSCDVLLLAEYRFDAQLPVFASGEHCKRSTIFCCCKKWSKNQKEKRLINGVAQNYQSNDLSPPSRQA